METKEESEAEKQRRKWCEHECPDRLYSECWMGCSWFDDDDYDDY